MSPRPFFLQRLSGRVSRKLHHIDREPVRAELTDADHRSIEHLYAFAVSLALCISVAALIVALSGRAGC